MGMILNVHVLHEYVDISCFLHSITEEYKSGSHVMENSLRLSAFACICSGRALW